MTLPPLEPSLEEELARAAEALSSARSIVVAAHTGPDGDALGSVLAVGLALGGRDGQVAVAWCGERVEIPAQYAFLPGTELLQTPDALPEADVALAVDCASLERLGPLEARFAAAPLLINVDHHASNTRFGHIRVVDTAAPSSSELVLRLLDRMGVEISSEVATCLYTGLFTDTGRFSYASVTPRAHAAAAHLVGCGVAVDRVAQAVFESLPFGYLQILGRTLERCELDDELSFVVCYLTQEDLRWAGISLDETEGVIDVVRAIREADVAAVLKELEDGRWKVSLRSKGRTDVGSIAQRLGGGGHRLAAAFTSSLDSARTIDLVRKALRDGR